MSRRQNQLFTPGAKIQVMASWGPYRFAVFDACSVPFDPLLHNWSTLILIASHTKYVYIYMHVHTSSYTRLPKCYPLVVDADQSSPMWLYAYIIYIYINWVR